MNTLVIYGHPSKSSLNTALADAYKGKIEAASHVKTLHLSDMQFELNLSENYTERTNQNLEADLLKAQELISWADHLVIAYPIWWGGMPALLKGFFDRVLLPDFAFKYVAGKPLPKKLLKGKSARLLVTADSPSFWYSFVVGRPSYIAMRRAILGFCGISPIKIKTYGNVRSANPEKIASWLEHAAKLGSTDASQNIHQNHRVLQHD